MLKRWNRTLKCTNLGAVDVETSAGNLDRCLVCRLVRANIKISSNRSKIWPLRAVCLADQHKNLSFVHPPLHLSSPFPYIVPSEKVPKR